MKQKRGELSPSIVASRTPIEQAILTLEDRKRHWTDDPKARKIFAYAKEKADGHLILPGKIHFAGLCVTGQPKASTSGFLPAHHFCHTQKREQPFGNGIGEAYGSGQES